MPGEPAYDDISGESSEEGQQDQISGEGTDDGGYLSTTGTGEAWYEGAHSLTFSNGAKETSGKRTGYLKGFNTWDTWRLIPTSKPMIASPAPKTSYVEIPGRHGAIDLSEWLTGGMVFGQRSGSWEFVIDNGWAYWETIRSDIYRRIHGKEFWIVLEDVPMRYWKGRLAVNEFRSGESNNTVSINYVVEPYSYPVLDPSDDWLWDPFCFETDYTDGRERTEAL